MQIGGTLITGLVRILVVVATLAAVYYFLVRPVLDTTEKVSGGITSSVQESIDNANKAIDNASNLSAGSQHQITTAIGDVPTDRLPRLSECINRKPGNVQHIERCARRLSR